MCASTVRGVACWVGMLGAVLGTSCLSMYATMGQPIQISGTVQDGETGSPVSGVAVHEVYDEAYRSPITTSNTKGQFQNSFTHLYCEKRTVWTKLGKQPKELHRIFGVKLSKRGYESKTFRVNMADLEKTEDGALDIALGVVSLQPETKQDGPAATAD